MRSSANSASKTTRPRRARCGGCASSCASSAPCRAPLRLRGVGAPTATRRGPAGLRLGALLAFEVAAVGILHRLGSSRRARVDWSDVRGWLDTVATEDAVVAALRLVALAVAYWILASTILYLLARATRLPSLARTVRWATLPGVRRVVDS